MTLAFTIAQASSSIDQKFWIHNAPFLPPHHRTGAHKGVIRRRTLASYQRGKPGIAFTAIRTRGWQQLCCFVPKCYPGCLCVHQLPDSSEIDRLENNDGILMIGSTNHLDKLDPGLSKRPSRFDRKYQFKNPSFEERIRYCDWWRAKFADNPDLATDADLSKSIAELTDGFSFAYLKETWVSSLLSLLYGTSSVGTKEVSGKLPAMLEKQIANLKAEMSGAGGNEQDKKKVEVKT